MSPLFPAFLRGKKGLKLSSCPGNYLQSVSWEPVCSGKRTGNALGRKFLSSGPCLPGVAGMVPMAGARPGLLLPLWGTTFNWLVVFFFLRLLFSLLQKQHMFFAEKWREGDENFHFYQYQCQAKSESCLVLCTIKRPKQPWMQWPL